jgi:L-threonylcarbamoyladenylate synthase
MNTEIIRIDEEIKLEKIRLAADKLKKGGLVAFPTETVYGLGANALDPDAVQKIFGAKGRPSDNPLIVHIASVDWLENIVSDISQEAKILIERFWPGPLTLIMPKRNNIPMTVTAGLDTVAVRFPSHPVAKALIFEAGLPIAAPSANTSGRPSPTNAQHVIEDLNGRVDIIIDAGSADVGLESTVIDVTGAVPMVLRPGGITLEEIREILPLARYDSALLNNKVETIKPKSPGMKYRHYSPKAELIIVQGNMEEVCERINLLVKDYMQKGIKIGVLATDQTICRYKNGLVLSMGNRDMPETIAQNLFRALREFDDSDIGLILAENVDENGIGFAVMNRMMKASGYNTIIA